MAEWTNLPRMHLVVALTGNLPLPLWLPGDTREHHGLTWAMPVVKGAVPTYLGTWVGM